MGASAVRMVVGRCLASVAVVVLVLWGCSGDGESGGGLLSGSGAGDGFRVHRSGMGGGRAEVSGIVEVDPEAGCVWLSEPNGTRYPVIWPVGTSARSDPFRITVWSDYFGIPVGRGQVVRPGDRVEGSGGYISTDSATRRYGLEPFPTDCVHVGTAAVFNAGSPIEVTPGVGLEVVETLADRFSLPQPIGLMLIAVNTMGPGAAVIDFVTGTVHQYDPAATGHPPGTIDGASSEGSLHLWSQGTVYSYSGPLDSGPMVYQPDPLRQTPAGMFTLVVLPAPDRKHTWLVQPGVGNDTTLVELVNLAGNRVARLMTTGIDGWWQPVGATIEGLVLVADDPEPVTRLVSSDGTVRAQVAGTALSVGRNGAAILRPDSSLVVTDAHLDNPTQVAKPTAGAWAPVGAPSSTGSLPAMTATDHFLVLLANNPQDGPLNAPTLTAINPAGHTTPILGLSQTPSIASWSPGEDWVVVVEDSSVTLVNTEDGSIHPLGPLVPDSYRVLTAY